jgi:hypothetical protein
MRSDSIVKSLDTGQNRFKLCHQAFKAIRKLHKPSTRIQDTATDALQRLAGTEQVMGAQSETPQAEPINDVPQGNAAEPSVAESMVNDVPQGDANTLITEGAASTTESPEPER